MALRDWIIPAGMLAAIDTDTAAGVVPGAERIVKYVDSSGNVSGYQKQVLLYNATGGACVAGAVYMVNYDGDEETNPSVIAEVAGTANREMVVATAATASTAWGWFVYAGYVDAMVEGTTDVAKDDYLKIVEATDADAFIKDGTTLTADSFAIACAAQAANSAVLTKVFLLGGEHDPD